MFTNPSDLKMNNYGSISRLLDISVLYEIQSKVSFDRIDKRYYYKLYVKKTLIQVFQKKKYKRKKSLHTKSCVNVP